jgi:pilus assembly protein CpaE
MSGKPRRAPSGEDREVINILLVDDNVELRDTIKKMLQYEKDLQVVGEAGTGREGVRKAKELQPHIIIMDINMPDMEGLEATSIIKREVPTTGVIMMSASSDTDYILQAMRAGAYDFLPKPPDLDKTITTIHTVFQKVKEENSRLPQGVGTYEPGPQDTDGGRGDDDRAGHIIVVYSPQGGCGTTTIATSLASGLMREDIKVLLVDADLQFADIGTFLSLQPQTTIAHLAEDVDDLDLEYFEDTVVTSHDSGLKVLLGPPRIDGSEALMTDPANTAIIIEQIAPFYDFVVVDTGSAFNGVVEELFYRASKVLLVTTPTYAALRHQKFLLEYLEQTLEYDTDKIFVTLNHVMDEHNMRGKPVTIAASRIEKYLGRPVVGEIPDVDPRPLLRTINKGIPVIAADRNQKNPPIKQLLELVDVVYHDLMGEDDDDESDDDPKKKGGSGIFRR